MLLATLLLSTAAHAAQKDCPTYWRHIRELNSRFEQKHDLKAGEKLWEALPTGKRLAPVGCEAHDDAIRRLDVEGKQRQKLLAKGDALGFKLSFRMMNVADGDFAESLDIDLGKTIVKRPREFLEYLNLEHGSEYCPDGLLKNTGDYDDATKDAAEFKARAAALRKVNDLQLAKLRDLCLSRLESKE